MAMQLIEYKDRHQLPDDDAVAIFDAITCTGGGAITPVLVKHYSPSKTLGIRDIYSAIQVHSIPNVDSFHFYCGHGVRDLHWLLSNKEKAFYFTFLRHPVRRAMSMLKTTLYYSQNFVPDFSLKLRSADRYLMHDYSLRDSLIHWYGNGDPGLAEEVVFQRYAFFGITEYYDKTILGLSEILPWLKGERIVNTHISPKYEGIEVSKFAEEYFYEKYAKDIEFYEKAVKEFTRRMSNFETINEHNHGEKWVPDIVTNEQSISSPNAQAAWQEQLLKCIREGRECVPADSLQLVYRVLAASREDCLMFFNYLKRWDTPLYKVYAFFCCAQLEMDKSEVLKRANGLFDIIEGIDNQNRVMPLIELRMVILGKVLDSYDIDMQDPFSQRMHIWLKRLRSVRGWEGGAWNAEARLFAAYGDYDNAILCAKEAVKVMPWDNGDDEIPNRLCQLLLDAGKADEAETFVRKELRSNPRQEWAMRQLALLLLHKGDFQEAEPAFKNALEKNPFWWQGWLTLSKASLEHGRIASALEQAREGMKAAPNNNQCAYNLCNLLVMQGELEEAESVAHDVLESYPHWGNFNSLLSQIHEKRGEHDKAMKEIAIAIEKDPDNMTFRENRVGMLIRYGHTDLAREEAEKSVEAFPHQAWPLLQLSKVLEASGEIEKGLECARKAYGIQPEKLTLSANMAHFLRLCRKYDECEDFCQKALQRNPNQGWAWRELSRMAMDQGDKAAAREFGAKAISVHPEDMEFQQFYTTLVSA